jgi:hypothetical protein
MTYIGGLPSHVSQVRLLSWPLHRSYTLELSMLNDRKSARTAQRKAGLLSSQATVTITAFAVGVVVAVLTGWFNQRNERQRHVTQIASNALLDGIAAITENQQCAAARDASKNYDLSENEKDHWNRRAVETSFMFYSAKARIAVYGNSEANRILASIERQGGIIGDDPVRRLVAELVLSFRKELGFKKNDVCEKDIATILFGPLQAERIGQSIGWPRSPLQQPNNGQLQQQDQASAHRDDHSGHAN